VSKKVRKKVSKNTKEKKNMQRRTTVARVGTQKIVSEKGGRERLPAFGFVAILFLFLVGGGYLYSVNQNAVQGFKMRQLENSIVSLKEDNTQLQINEADRRSLAQLEAAASETNMQKVGEVTVIRDESGEVALK
jgi:hypothetical protein